MQSSAAARAALILDVDQDLDPWQVRRQGTKIASPRCPRGAAPCGGGVLCRLGGGYALLEILQAELQLAGIELLRAAAELAALQLPDQEPQLLDLGLRRIMLLANEVALSASGIPLRQNSIALDLESSNPGALAGGDFGHLLQHQQQSVGITWKIIQRQRHGAILLA